MRILRWGPGAGEPRGVGPIGRPRHWASVPTSAAVAALLVQGCVGTAPRPPVFPPSPAASGRGGALAVDEVRISETVVADSIEDDPGMEALVAPFRNRMGEETRQVIGEASGVLAKSIPEGTLGNFATDAMLWAARRESAGPVQMALTNNGGLRIPIPPGPITVGQMFELMPFENMLSVLTLTGSQVQALADALAARRGEPIAGFSFRIEVSGGDRVARDILVDGALLDPKAEYRLVTNDYMANGGEELAPLLNPVAREDLPVLVRDAFISYVRDKRVIDVEIGGRITGGIE
jgi:2',3'-cyclic-nucleotide 2'-phosphodiesterase (5'-nucleotidase family)